MKVMTVTPAYNRDYPRATEAVVAFNNDDDFYIADISCPWNGLPVNRSQLITDGYTHVNVRFNKLRGIEVVALPPPQPEAQ